MTEAKMIPIAKKIADDKYWVWLEPIKIIRHRKWLFFGKVVYIEVRSNAEALGMDVSVYFSGTTDYLLNAGYLPR